jgi:hypothetical protein
MGFHPVAVAQYNTQGTPTNHKNTSHKLRPSSPMKTPSRKHKKNREHKQL